MYQEDKQHGETPEPTLTEFAAWLRTKNPNEYYWWLDGNICACAQFARETHRWGSWSNRSTVRRAVYHQTAWGKLDHFSKMAALFVTPDGKKCNPHLSLPGYGRFGDLLQLVETKLAEELKV